MKGGLKTYSHLAGARRMPSEYEIVTSDLLYYVGRGFEVDVPVADWYRRHQQGSALAAPNWDDFRDPRETTYSKYTALQREKETHVDGILRSIEASDYDSRLTPEWLSNLERILSPARYLFHGLQMTAAYVGQMAPSGRVTIVAALQAADEMRRIQRFAYRMAQLRLRQPEFGARGLDEWREQARWQPLRRLIEELLVTYDFGESLSALNLCVKPLIDELFLTRIAELARTSGDYLFGEICFSLAEDSAWHRAWTESLVRHLLAARAENEAVLRGWIGRWLPRAEESAEALAGSFGLGRGPGSTQAWLSSLGLAS
jgi:toluene monooxygenase system protein E